LELGDLLFRFVMAQAGVAKLVDATDLSQLSARVETRDAELLKVGETFQMAIPSQALQWEGVETRRAAPNANAMVKG
jgi:hypothetical protein